MGLGDIITFLGPFSLSAMVFVFLTLISSMLFFYRNEDKFTVLFVFLIMLFLLGYTVSNSLLAFLGINIQSPYRVEENKNLIILCSRLEILFLTLSIVVFSGFVSFLVKGKVALFKFLLVTLAGLVVGGLSLFSDKFFYSDRLKLNINKYMAQEGELFIVFIAFFALVVVSELFFLAFSFKKVRKSSSFAPEVLRSIFFGIFAVIFFGVLEIFELFGVIRIYPYVPSLLGLGIVFLGVVLLRLVLYEFYQKVRELKLFDYLIEQSGEKSSRLLKDLVSEYSKFDSSLSRLRELFEESFKLPSLSLEYANDIVEKIKKFLEYYHSKLPEFEELFEEIRIGEESKNLIESVDVREISVEMERGLQEFERLKKKIEEVKYYSYSVIVEDFSLFVENFSKLDNVFVQVYGMVESINELLEKLRIISINTEIISSKRSFKELPFLEAISSQIFEKVSDFGILMKFVLRDLDKLKSIESEIRDSIAKGNEVILKTIDRLKLYDFRFEVPKELIFVLSDTYSKMLNVWEYEKVIKNFVSELKNFVFVYAKEFYQELKLNFPLAREVFSIQRDFSENTKSLSRNIFSMDNVFKKMRESLQKFSVD